MKNQHKNRYLLYLFSLMPGAAEMYMGLMHMGVSLMATFFASALLVAVFDQFDGMLFLPVLLWFFGFFHAINLIQCDEEVFDATEDLYIWDEFFGDNVFHVSRAFPRKWGAAVLILGGLSLLWKNIAGIVQDTVALYYGWEWWGHSELRDILNVVPRIFLSLLLIVLGIRLVRGKKAELEQKAAALPETIQDSPVETEGSHEQ